MNPVPLPPNDLPALAPLVNGTLWADWAKAGRVFPLSSFRDAVHYLRLKPFTSCRIVVFAEPDGSDPPRGFLLYLYADLDRAREAFEKAQSKHPRSATRPPFLCESTRVVGVPFPTDRELPGLHKFYRRQGFRTLVGGALPAYPADEWHLRTQPLERELLAYKPGRRAVYRLQVKLRRREPTDQRINLRTHVKLESTATAVESHQRLATIHDQLPADASWSVPEPFGHCEGLLAREWIEGETLLDRIRMKCAHSKSFDRLGHAIAELHDLKSTANTAVMSSGEPTATALDLAQLVPDERNRVLDIGKRLEWELGRGSDEQVLIHGDLHPGQVIDNNSRVVLMDFDRSMIGPRARDIGDFLSRLDELRAGPDAAEAFMSGYTAALGRPVDDSEFSIHRAAATFRRACFPFRELDEGWRQSIDRSLSEVESLLGAVRQ